MDKNKKFNVKWIALHILCSVMFGAFVPNDIAEKVARNIFVENVHLHDGNAFMVSHVEIIEEGGNELIYIFHLEPKGFIMVSANDQAVPNLAFGFKHSFISDDMPSNLNSLMNQYKLELINMVNNQNDSMPEIKELWDGYVNGSGLKIDHSRDVSPLIDAEFDQGGSWNNGIQAEIGFNGPVGCVAVAMCQVMHYWKYPSYGIGSNYYTENDYGYIEVDFEDTFYDFENMAATYATPASQLVLFHAGVSVNMDYDWSGSGAWVVGSYPSAFYAMENFFAYDSDISYQWKDNHATDEYRNIIKNELNHNRPVISQGYGSSYGGGGHAWNIDGYSGNNLHCNWGWGGSSNGFYNLTSMGGFPDDQAVIIGILPQMDDPAALFEYDVNDLTVNFVDLSEIINEVELETWLWSFGDGISSSSVSPTHTYAQGGLYEVSLTVMNVYGIESEPHVENIDLQSGMAGDINDDSILNILDIVLIVNFILNTDTPDASELVSADLNGDGVLNILDIVILTNLILGS